MRIKATQLPDPSDMAEILAPALVEAGQALVAQMHRRVSRGIGVDDAAMPKYTPAYAEHKRAHGRDPKIRDLTFTGSMMRSIHLESVSVDGSRASIAIGFSNANDLRKAAWNHAKTPWFGASPKDRELITALFKARAASILQDTDT